MINLSIVIANYNSDLYLGNLLMSIQKQNYSLGALEVILVDDASSDNSCFQAKDIVPDIKIVRNKKRKGAAFSKNVGLDLASYEWVAFFDSDVVLPFKFLNDFILFCSKHKSAVCFQPKLLFLNNKQILNSTGGIANKYAYAWDRGVFEEDSSQYDNETDIIFACSAAMAIKKKIAIDVGGFDGDFFYLNEDYDFGYRLLMMGKKVCYVPNFECFHRMSASMGRANPEVKYLIERNRLMSIAKNYELRTILGLFSDLIKIRFRKYKNAYNNYVGEKKPFVFAALKAWMSFLVNLPVLLFKRRKIQQNRRVPDYKIFLIMGKYKDCFPSFLDEKLIDEKS